MRLVNIRNFKCVYGKMKLYSGPKNVQIKIDNQKVIRFRIISSPGNYFIKITFLFLIKRSNGNIYILYYSGVSVFVP